MALDVIEKGALFVDNRDAFDAVWRYYDRTAHSFCALIAANRGVRVDESALASYRQYVKENTSFGSGLRSLQCYLAAFMAVSDEPEALVERVKAAYAALKAGLPSKAGLTGLWLSALIIGLYSDEKGHYALADGTAAQFFAFRKKHRFRVSSADLPFCTLLALRGISPEAAAEEAETCFKLFREKPRFRAAWQLCELLAKNPAQPKGKCAAARELRLRLREKYRLLDFSHELAAVLADADTLLPAADDAMAVSDWLAEDKRFDWKRVDRDTRLFFAFCLASPDEERVLAAIAAFITKRQQQAAAAAAA